MILCWAVVVSITIPLITIEIPRKFVMVKDLEIILVA